MADNGGYFLAGCNWNLESDGLFRYQIRQVLLYR